jgi:hypothetical protein
MRWVALAALLAGCFESDLRYCENGAICPQTLVCTERAPTSCGDEENVAPCRAMPDRTGCSSTLMPVGTCASGVCSECNANLQECRFTEWRPMTSGTDKKLHAIWVGANDNIYAAGEAGTVVHYDGTMWSPLMPPSNDTLVGVWGTGDELYVVAQNGNAFHYTGSWQSITPAINPATSSPYTLFGVWGSDPANVLAVGESGAILKLAGTAWQAQTSNTMVPLRTISGTSATDIYAAGASGVVQHFDGGTWQPAPGTPLTGVTIYSVWSLGALVVAVGYMGPMAIIKRMAEAPTWTTYMQATTTFNGVWGSGDTNIFAVGTQGTIVRYDGGQWTPMTSSTTVDLAAIGGTGDNAFAVGANGTILRLAF